jgi:hypothetical protein
MSGPTGSIVALCALLPLLVACSRADGEPVVVRDSAGAAITLSRAPAWAPAAEWRVADRQRLEVGGMAGQRYYEFSAVGDARLLDDGRLLVTHQSRPPEVRLYDARGSFLRAFAGEGTEEGRCRYILRTWGPDADTLIVYDPTLGRLNYFHIQGRLIRVASLPGGADVLWVDRLRDGALLGRPNSPRPGDNGRTRASFAYSRLDPANMTLAPVVDALGAEFIVHTAPDQLPRLEQVLFSPFTTAIAGGAGVYLSDTRDFWIDERALDGSLVRRFGRDWTAPAIDRRFIREYRDRRLAAAGPAVRQVRQELEGAVFADRLPAHEPTMMVDPSGHLWILHLPGRPGDDRQWTVFAPDGRWLGEVATPAALRVTEIGERHVVGVWRGETGTITVRVYDLEKPAGP